jgi:hypothetical protein
MHAAIDAYAEAGLQLLKFLNACKRDWQEHFNALDEMLEKGWRSMATPQDQRTKFSRLAKWRDDLICESHLCQLRNLVDDLEEKRGDLEDLAFHALLLASRFLEHVDHLAQQLISSSAKLSEWIETSRGDAAFPISDEELGELDRALNRERFLLTKAAEALSDPIEQGIARAFVEMESAAAVSDDDVRRWASGQIEKLSKPIAYEGEWIRQSRLGKICKMDRSQFERWMKANLPSAARHKEGSRWLVNAQAFATAWTDDGRSLNDRLLFLFPSLKEIVSRT